MPDVHLLIWLLVSIASAALYIADSGSARLFAEFPHIKKPNGPLRWFHAGRIKRVGGIMPYPWYCTTTADPTGLYFATSILWVPHRCIQIPWHDVDLRDEDPSDWRMEFFIPKARVEVRLHKAIVSRLLEDRQGQHSSHDGRA